MTIPEITLSDGRQIPAVGFGTYPLRGEDGVRAISGAIEVGYRLIDTAFNYDNEGAVGQAIRRGGVPRDDLFITSKLPGRYHQRPQADYAIRESLWRLGLEYLDLYLIHWPNPQQGHYSQAWEALIAARDAGMLRSIGVSNFTADMLERLQAETGELPAVNQVELHPYFPQQELLQVHRELGIQTESWSPLGKARAPYGERAIVMAAEAHGVTPAQVILRWQTQLGSIPIPKSASRQRQVENLDIFDFALTEAEMAAITALGRSDGRLFGGDPNTHEEL